VTTISKLRISEQAAKDEWIKSLGSEQPSRWAGEEQLYFQANTRVKGYSISSSRICHRSA
jgi:hypothetical protein